MVDALPVDSTEKPKSTVQWVPSHFNVPIEARLYDHLFVSEEPPDAEWEQALNPNSLVVKSNALVDPSLFKWGATPESHFQVAYLLFYSSSGLVRAPRILCHRPQKSNRHSCCFLTFI